ncbi:hypothetical protein J2Z83_001852 [Virgibacillus natechei]|uniref:ComG operon protein 7 n=1 Tax=Virgibacillus natechei TaxID=1216297 RepID=A0ABS4IFN1_9BACI|nr:hypothetical protein [Virgibacillus natechei]MBP1969745.1 hypothetical protein [Virgibacillus natechei]UZD11465.1 hypothetical protein OLD84_10850 [Virgibacillus natechei]
MKKRLPFMNNNAGFFLPYVLFVTTIVFIFITATISMYTTNIKVTETHLEQVKIETLFQMAYSKFSEEYKDSELNYGKKNYTFPYGSVEITAEPLDENILHLYFEVTTDKGYVYSITHTSHVDLNNDHSEEHAAT